MSWEHERCLAQPKLVIRQILELKDRVLPCSVTACFTHIQSLKKLVSSESLISRNILKITDIEEHFDKFYSKFSDPHQITSCLRVLIGDQVNTIFDHTV